jgi:hypothetical protein
LGGIVLDSQVESDAACPSKTAQGTISSFTSTGDTFVNWSLTSPGTFPAINSTGQGLLSATVSQLSADGASNGNIALNLSAFQTIKVQ